MRFSGLPAPWVKMVSAPGEALTLSRRSGAQLDLELGRGPMGATSPLVPIDRQGRFEFAVPAGAYECRVQDAAGNVLKTVEFQTPLAKDKTLVITGK